ncbi:hypothetical protein ACQXR1_11320 [Bacillus sp. ATD]|uniref:hypothetical protein n=1 Tax=Bacillus sp. ATD TaxID=3422305 RepID=UPI003D3465A9
MTKIEELFAYLDRLIALQSAGHAVRKEIAEVIAEIRHEVGLAKENDETTVLIDGKTVGNSSTKSIWKGML